MLFYPLDGVFDSFIHIWCNWNWGTQQYDSWYWSTQIQMRQDPFKWHVIVSPFRHQSARRNHRQFHGESCRGNISSGNGIWPSAYEQRHYHQHDVSFGPCIDSCLSPFSRPESESEYLIEIEALSIFYSLFVGNLSKFQEFPFEIKCIYMAFAFGEGGQLIEGGGIERWICRSQDNN